MYNQTAPINPFIQKLLPNFLQLQNLQRRTLVICLSIRQKGSIIFHACMVAVVPTNTPELPNLPLGLAVSQGDEALGGSSGRTRQLPFGGAGFYFHTSNIA